MMLGRVEDGLEIVRACRDRYDGRVRNPFDEYECGHWRGQPFVEVRAGAIDVRRYDYVPFPPSPAPAD